MEKTHSKTKKAAAQPMAASTVPPETEAQREESIMPNLEVILLDGGLTIALPPAVGAESPWCEQDDQDHERCVVTIKRGTKTFVEVGLALAEVKQKRLYRKTHRTFDGFCKEHVGFQRHYGYRLIEAAETTGRLLSRGDSPAPQSEAQARQLAGLSEEDQVEVMKSAAAAAGGTPTTKSIKEAATKKKNGTTVNVVKEDDSLVETTGTEDATSAAKAPVRRKQVEAISIRSTIEKVASAITLLKSDEEDVDVEKLLELLEDIELGLQEFQHTVEEQTPVGTQECK